MLALMLKNRDRLPPSRFDCGRDDLLIKYNRALHLALIEGGISHRYDEFAGGCEWTYWAEHLTDTLLFF